MDSQISSEDFGEMFVPTLPDLTEDGDNYEILVPRPDYDVEPILEFLRLKDGPGTGDYDVTIEFSVYAFLVLAHHPNFEETFHVVLFETHCSPSGTAKTRPTQARAAFAHGRIFGNA